MSEHVSETCHEGDGLWLPLIEYSVKSGVSLSTIRRKIKSNSIPFRLEKGRYLILFTDGAIPTGRPLIATVPVERERHVEPPKRAEPEPTSAGGWSLPLVENSVRMVSDAFEHALKEKDERIRMLEASNRELQERVKELQTLVRVIEEKYEIRY